MQTITELSLERAKGGVFTRQEVACWIDSDGARLDALLKRAVAAGEILRIRRGFFCLAARYTQHSVHPFELAQRIFGPSYVSLEAALAHHGWIPEAVYTITCVSRSRSRNFDTPLGLFSYARVPQKRFYAGVQRQELQSEGVFFLAEPLKALADYVYVHGVDWVGLCPVRESLRVENTELDTLTVESFETLTGVYRSGRVRRFLDTMRKDLKL